MPITRVVARGWTVALAVAFALEPLGAFQTTTVSDLSRLEIMTGVDVMVCGNVAGVRTDPKGSLLLDLDRPAPQQTGTFRIPKPAAFGADFDRRVLDVRVCVNGTVEQFGGRAAVKVTDLESLWSDTVAIKRPAGFAEGVRDMVTTQGVTGPHLIGAPVRVRYPDAATRAKRTGLVDAEIIIRADGSVGQVRVSKSADVLWGLDDAALQAARSLRFQPAVADGQAVDVVTRFRVTFVTGKDPSVAVFEGFGLRPAPEGAVEEARVTGLQVVTSVKPKYTPDAMRALIQGSVQLEAVVQRDGTVRVVRVVRSLDPFGLDVAAIRCAEEWRFQPGQIAGQPVDTRITMVLEFRLH
jgi:TonB family protein